MIRTVLAITGAFMIAGAAWTGVILALGYRAIRRDDHEHERRLRQYIDAGLDELGRYVERRQQPSQSIVDSRFDTIRRAETWEL